MIEELTISSLFHNTGMVFKKKKKQVKISIGDLTIGRHNKCTGFEIVLELSIFHSVVQTFHFFLFFLLRKTRTITTKGRNSWCGHKGPSIKIMQQICFEANASHAVGCEWITRRLNQNVDFALVHMGESLKFYISNKLWYVCYWFTGQIVTKQIVTDF